MKEILVVDLDGYIIASKVGEHSNVVEIIQDDQVTSYEVGTSQPVGFYKPKFDFESGEWLESLTQEEIDELHVIPDVPPTPEQLKIVELESKIDEQQTPRIAELETQVSTQQSDLDDMVLLLADIITGA